MITKLTLLATISLTSAAMAMDTQTFDAPFNQNQTVLLYDAAMPTKSSATYDQFKSDPVVSIYQAPVQEYTDVTRKFDLLGGTDVLAFSTAFTQEQLSVITQTAPISELTAKQIQAILYQPAATKYNLLSSLTTPPLNLELIYKPSDYSFFSSSWGSALDILTQKKNRAFYLVPMAMFVLAHINAHNK